ncbi:unnamed protein product [Arctia plantaginis]|uniref:Uncharacterized protein n=1 Tax=Arctia plantaginis TaxID=874455 RepID=A0A8S1BFN7_ARCPL|nr:unnamed protein product [Arctia plantaginis]CAB3255764.1 unnamed protein product [Arctia plantaginis]
MMYRAVIFFVFVASAAPDDSWRQCYGVQNYMMQCCTGITTRAITEHKVFMECFENRKPGPPPPVSCEVDQCVGKKFGYYGDDGVDKEAFTSFIENKIVDNEALVAVIKEKCINSDLSKYGHPDLCDIMKMQICFYNQFLKECPKWSNEDKCEGFEEIVIPECVFDD